MKQRLAHLVLPASLNYLHPAVDFICSLADTVGLQEDEVNDLHLAFEEVVVNIIKHGYEENPEESFELDCLRLPTGLQLTLRDKGMPFDPDLLPVYTPHHPEEASMDSLGAFLAEKVLDELEYNHLGRHGNETILVKHGRRHRIDEEYPALSEEKTKTTAKPRKPLPEGYVIRPLRTREAVEVSRTAYRSYGYIHEPFIYFPDRVIYMNRTGRLDSLVAVSSEHEILGHIALKYPTRGSKVAELGVAFVNPDYEDGDLLAELVREGVDLALNKDLHALYAQAPLQLDADRTVAAANGFTPCAIKLGLYPADHPPEDLSSRITYKSCGLVLSKSLHTDRKRILYPPWDHSRQLRTLYERLGLTVKFQAPEEQLNPEPWSDTIIRAVAAPLFNVADMFLDKVGANWEHTLRVHWRHLLLEKKDAIYLHLDLEHPATPFLSQTCEAWGFFYAGVVPDSINGHDALVLQYINNVRVDLPEEGPEHPVTACLTDYIRRQDGVKELWEP